MRMRAGERRDERPRTASDIDDLTDPAPVVARGKLRPDTLRLRGHEVVEGPGDLGVGLEILPQGKAENIRVTRFSRAHRAQQCRPCPVHATAEAVLVKPAPHACRIFEKTACWSQGEAPWLGFLKNSASHEKPQNTPQHLLVRGAAPGELLQPRQPARDEVRDTKGCYDPDRPRVVRSIRGWSLNHADSVITFSQRRG